MEANGNLREGGGPAGNFDHNVLYTYARSVEP